MFTYNNISVWLTFIQPALIIISRVKKLVIHPVRDRLGVYIEHVTSLTESVATGEFLSRVPADVRSRDTQTHISRRDRGRCCLSQVTGVRGTTSGFIGSGRRGKELF